MLHLAGWFEDVDQAAAAADIAAMPDEVLFFSGDIVRVPPPVANLIALFGLTAATTFTSAQLQAPSLRALANLDILPFGRAATFENPQPVVYMGNNPQSLIPDENLTFETNTDHAAAIEIYGFALLGDGPIAVVNGEIFSVRATAAITLVDGVWTNGVLTFIQDLPVGRYQVVGLRVESANAVAGRLVFPGAVYRPGVPAVNAPSDVDYPFFRSGRLGVMGEFHTTSPPSIDIVGVTDTAETVILDLIKVG